MQSPPPSNIATNVGLPLWLIAVVAGVFATSSFDLFLNVVISGFNIRISQIFMLVLIVTFAHQTLSKPTIIMPLGGAYLIVWSCFIFLFVPNTSFFVRSMGYAVWLLFYLFLTFSFVNLFTTPKIIEKLIKLYILSFFLVALFGLCQIVSGAVGLPAPLVTQAWTERFVRINGFSYEPSFFATYLTLGYLLCAHLTYKKIFLFSKTLQKTITWIILIVMILSTSRIGWLVVIMWHLQYPLRLLWTAFSVGKMRISDLKVACGLIGVFLSGLIFIIAIIGFDGIQFILQGTGLRGTSSHSVSDRTSTMTETFTLFFQSPIVGRSLGGVATAISENRGYTFITSTITKKNEGIMVFAEVLAASGIIGIIPFVIYIFKIVVEPWRLSRFIKAPRERAILTGMLLALLVELLILQINQNILRPYLWVHIALLSSTFLTYRQELVKHRKQIEPSI